MARLKREWEISSSAVATILVVVGFYISHTAAAVLLLVAGAGLLYIISHWPSDSRPQKTWRRAGFAVVVVNYPVP